MFRSLLAFAAALVLCTPASADPVPDLPDVPVSPPVAPTATPEPKRPDPMEQITVIGSRENVRDLTGAGTYVDVEDLKRMGYDDINRALRQAPGVYLREEDGYGLFPNVSLRGVDTSRSSKLTVMEDGILTAPAAYSAPAAYYSPTTGRMHGIEVLKGSSQVRYGPHTTGGVINYVSTPVPEGFQGHLDLSYGTNNELRQHVWLGNSWSSDLGLFGFVAEHYFRRSDGFKKIDGTASLGSDDDTGFRKSEPMLKLFFEPKTSRYQRWEAKIGFTELDANETYLGLTDADFSGDPVRRYSASRFDNIETKHRRSYLRWTQELSDSLTLTTTGYHNTFRRNWFKLRGDGEDLATDLPCFEGLAACDLRYRANRRSYYAGGVESVLDWDTSLGETEHAVRFGLRYHQDRIKRDQNNSTFVQLADGSIDWSDPRNGDGDACSGGCRTQKSEAMAAYLEDTIQYGAWTFRPGVRFERVGQTLRDRTNDAAGNATVRLPTERGALTFWAPGLGVRYAASDTLMLFGGVHRGVSVPSPRGALVSGLREETSIGTELGARWSPAPFLQTEMSLFYTDFDELIVSESLGSGNPQDENVGDVRTYGVEFAAAFDAGAWQRWTFSNPWRLALTLTKAELDGDANSANSESIFAGGRDGADVPYIPDYQVSLGTGLQFDRLGLFVDASWVDETFATALNSNDPVDAAGNPNYNFGRTDSYVVVDLSARYALTERTALTFHVHNLFDEEYIVSRHPIGPRPGKPRSARVGFALDF